MHKLTSQFPALKALINWLPTYFLVTAIVIRKGPRVWIYWSISTLTGLLLALTLRQALPIAEGFITGGFIILALLMMDKYQKTGERRHSSNHMILTFATTGFFVMIFPYLTKIWLLLS